ncbi:hypothetical protein MPLDJ20_210028 [Mesorhizobium plurifarium]|uniref:Uncharacterized protein n=1 Tax=Mesorhizobium plurifarium TaxID=69974 RepID=A0A090F890_MESPL|nr:hypothetical protein MPLDJ20_210028 [Mesorhizobium plurifarium]
MVRGVVHPNWKRLREAPPSGLPAISPARGEIGGFGALLNPATLAIGESRRHG